MQQADRANTRKGGRSSAPKIEKNIRFRPARWLRDWVENGNCVEIFPGKGGYLGYNLGPDRAGGVAKRDALEIELNRLNGWKVLRAYMVRTGHLHAGFQI